MLEVRWSEVSEVVWLASESDGDAGATSVCSSSLSSSDGGGVRSVAQAGGLASLL